MKSSLHRAMVIVVTLGAAPATLAHAQVDPDSVRRRINCQLAVVVIETGLPVLKKTWANQYIVFCSGAERARAYLSAARAARHLTDTTDVRRAILPASGFYDGDLFREVLSIANDRSASLTARAFAFVALAEIDDPRSIAHYGGFVSGLAPNGIPRGTCETRSFHPRTPVIGPTPLPVDYRDQMRIVAKTVAADVSEPDQIRSAARCAW